jgi:hypothetical protein
MILEPIRMLLLSNGSIMKKQENLIGKLSISDSMVQLLICKTKTTTRSRGLRTRLNVDPTLARA